MSSSELQSPASQTTFYTVQAGMAEALKRPGLTVSAVATFDSLDTTIV
jgi:hypothetical protein